MGVKVSGTDEVSKQFDEALGIFDEEITRELSYIGEYAVGVARKPHAGDWKDYTCNLRSSIGYGVYKRGEESTQSAFEVVRRTDKKTGKVYEGTEGHNEGLKLVEQLGKKYSDSYALVVVAGMDYASLVEARDNRDVLASATLDAMKKVDRFMNGAIDRAVKRIDRLNK